MFTNELMAITVYESYKIYACTTVQGHLTESFFQTFLSILSHNQKIRQMHTVYVTNIINRKLSSTFILILFKKSKFFILIDEK